MAALLSGCEDPSKLLFNNPNDPINPAYTPAIPTGLRVTLIGESSRTLSWNAGNAYVVRYIVERKLGGGGLYSTVGSALPSVTSFTDTSATITDTTYFYRVSAVSGNGNMAPSLPVSVILPFPSPSGLHMVCVSGLEVILTWTDNSTFETGFQIESSANGGPFGILALLPRDSVRYRAVQLAAGTVYRFRVRAFTQKNVSGYSPELGIRSVTQPFELVWSARTVAEADAVGALAFSPDGRTVASGGTSSVEVWLVDTGGRKALMSHPGWGTETDMAFAPGGAALAVRHGGLVEIYDVRSGALQRILTWIGSATGASVSFSKGGTRLVSGGDSAVAFWDWNTGTLDHSFDTPLRATIARLSPDGGTVATGSPVTPLTYYRASDGVVAGSLPGQSSVNQIAYSPDGTVLAVSSANDRTVRLWSTSTGSLFHALPGATHGWSIAFSPDGKWVAASDWLIAPSPGDETTGEARLWNVSDGSLVRTFPGNFQTGAVAFSPYGNLIAVGKSGAVDLWAVAGAWVLTP